MSNENKQPNLSKILEKNISTRGNINLKGYRLGPNPNATLQNIASQSLNQAQQGDINPLPLETPKHPLTP
jgi:uncharacterized lipoprotein YajG